VKGAPKYSSFYCSFFSYGTFYCTSGDSAIQSSLNPFWVLTKSFRNSGFKFYGEKALIALWKKKVFETGRGHFLLNLGMGSIRILVPAMLANQKAFMDHRNEMP